MSTLEELMAEAKTIRAQYRATKDPAIRSVIRKRYEQIDCALERQKFTPPPLPPTEAYSPAYAETQRIDYTCPECKAVVTISKERIGQKEKCRKCGAYFTIRGQLSIGSIAISLPSRRVLIMFGGLTFLVFGAIAGLLVARLEPEGRGLPTPNTVPANPFVPEGTEAGEVRTFSGIKMVWVPAGIFDMGSLNGSDDEIPLHNVTIPSGFWLGQCEVNAVQWSSLMDADTGKKGATESKDNDRAVGPASSIEWCDCQIFINKLNKKGEATFRLPTEREWEYACRAGSKGDYCYGDDIKRLGEYAWYDSNSRFGKDGVGAQMSHAVGTKMPNAWGLYDMHGNVWEWCQDVYSDVYQSPEVIHPTGAIEDLSANHGRCRHVCRGGAFDIYGEYCRSASRGNIIPDYSHYVKGFRLAASPSRMQPLPEDLSRTYPTSVVTALDELKSGAREGDIAAQMVLAKRCRRGIGVPEDSAEAFRWYMRAAEQGNAEAQKTLGVIYSTGDGITKDLKEAARWYRKAAVQGERDAAVSLNKLVGIDIKDLINGHVYKTKSRVNLISPEMFDTMCKSGNQSITGEQTLPVGGAFQVLGQSGFSQALGRLDFSNAWYKVAVSGGGQNWVMYLNVSDLVDLADITQDNMGNLNLGITDSAAGLIQHGMSYRDVVRIIGFEATTNSGPFGLTSQDQICTSTWLLESSREYIVVDFRNGVVSTKYSSIGYLH